MTEWKTGDVITAERLNEMMVTPLIIYLVDEGILGATYNQIKTAVMAGKSVILSRSASSENADLIINCKLASFGEDEVHSHYIATFLGDEVFLTYGSNDPDVEMEED